MEEEKSFSWNVMVASWNACNFLLPHKFNTYLLPFDFVSSTCAFAGTCLLFEYIWYGASSIEVALVDTHLEWWGLYNFFTYGIQYMETTNDKTKVSAVSKP